MSFNDEIKRHLIAYKKLQFKNYHHGLWQNNPENVLEYAFRPEEGDNNLIETFKAKFLAFEEDLKKEKKNLAKACL